MKKRLLLGITAVALTVMCIGFVGCSNNDGVNAKAVKGYSVTKEQWDKAFTSVSGTDKFSLELSSVIDFTAELDFSYGGGTKQSGGYTGTETIRGTKNGDKEHSFTGSEAKFSGDMKFVSEFEDLGLTESAKKEDEIFAEKNDSSYSSYTTYTKDKNDE